jgi:hypothetical protein
MTAIFSFGSKIGMAYLETDPGKADRETVLNLLMRGEYTGPQPVLEVDLVVAGGVTSLPNSPKRSWSGLALPPATAMFVSLRAGLGVRELVKRRSEVRAGSSLRLILGRIDPLDSCCHFFRTVMSQPSWTSEKTKLSRKQ